MDINNFAIKHYRKKETLILVIPNNVGSKLWINKKSSLKPYDKIMTYIFGDDDVTYQSEGLYTQPDVIDLVRLYPLCCKNFKKRVHNLIQNIVAVKIKENKQ